ncbi:GNAT family N-acetyltransferase [bacterium]|nr:GNAT family N-acetyltransferase [bacterium]
MGNKYFGEIARLKITASNEFIPTVTGFVRNIGERLEIDKTMNRKLELLVEEAALNVINLGFDPGEKGEYEVAFKRLPGKIVVEVADKGLPVDYNKVESDFEAGLGILLMKKLADEVNFVNRGKDGKLVEITLNLPYATPEELELQSQLEKTAALAPEGEELTFRAATIDDTTGITRSIYRTYGYTYLSDTLYYPEKIAEMIQEGYLCPVIALNPDGEVVGHASIRLEFPGAKVGEFGQLVADPRYRGRGIAKKLNHMLVDAAKITGMFGYYADAVTTHPYSQKTILKSDAHEAAYMPGFVPASFSIKKMKVDESADRHAEIVYFRRIAKNRKPTIYTPLQHSTMIKNIYDLNNLDYTIAPMKINEVDYQAVTEVRTRVLETPNRAFISIDEYGLDFDNMLKKQLKQLCLKKIEIIILDLPLENPSTRNKSVVAEKLGFFFSGVIPGMSIHGGDLLRLIYLNNVDIAADKPVIVTDFGKELANYVLWCSSMV